MNQHHVIKMLVAFVCMHAATPLHAMQDKPQHTFDTFNVQREQQADTHEQMRNQPVNDERHRTQSHSTQTNDMYTTHTYQYIPRQDVVDPKRELREKHSAFWRPAGVSYAITSVTTAIGTFCIAGPWGLVGGALAGLLLSSGYEMHIGDGDPNKALRAAGVVVSTLAATAIEAGGVGLSSLKK